MKNNKLVTSLFLKIFGIITMTCDHFIKIAKSLEVTFLSEELIKIFSIIGRLSFPIFAFLIVEGMIHSRNQIKYLIRLFSLALICDVGFYLISSSYLGNPITTLFLGALTIYFLNIKNKYLKLLSLIPLGIILLISFEIIPLISMYDLYGYLLIMMFYFSIPLSKIICKEVAKLLQIDEETFNSEYLFLTRKLLSCLLFLIFTILIWFINPIYKNNNIFIDEPALQLYSLISCLPLLFYNGKKGYNNKVVQYTFYLYFPLHLCIIYLFLFLI